MTLINGFDRSTSALLRVLRANETGEVSLLAESQEHAIRGTVGDKDAVVKQNVMRKTPPRGVELYGEKLRVRCVYKYGDVKLTCRTS